jgi:integrative and conjugative element protein (TIGR02256 family)
MLWRSSLLADALLLVEPEVLETLNPFRQMSAHCLEAGGILIGYRRGPHLHVVEATVPGQLDRRARCGFERADPSHEEIAHLRWTQSRQRLDYMGEWHTHPESAPTPSTLDRREWTLILRDRNHPMIFLILGLSDSWVGIGHRGVIERAFSSPESQRP